MELQAHISKQFKGTIWRMEIDALRDIIFLEIRNNEDRRVTFTAINLITAKTYFDNLTTPERWLTGMEAAYNGVLLLHNYQSETGPTHKGISAIDAVSGDILWSNYTIAFDHLSVNGPVAYDSRIQPRKLFLIDINTGATIRNYNPSIDIVLNNNIALPAMISPADLPADIVVVNTFGNMVHYLEYNKFRIVSLHALMEGQLTQSVLVMDSGETVYRDLLNQDIQKIQPEAFILHQNQLIYIKNKSELKVLTL